MLITRSGSAANHGHKSAKLDKPTFSKSKEPGGVVFTHAGARDFTTKSRHSYHIEISASDIEGTLLALSKAAQSQPAAFELTLAASLKPLCILQAVASGILAPHANRTATEA